MSNVLKKVKHAALSMQRHNWEQGVLAQAFLEAGDTETALLLAVEGANRQNTEGRCCHIAGSTASTDPCAVGEALIAACEQTNDPVLIEAKDRLLRWALELAPRNSDGIVYHFSDGTEFWVDSMYMLPPFLARAGHYDEALKQMDGYWNALFIPEKGLLAHRWDDAAKRTDAASWQGSVYGKIAALVALRRGNSVFDAQADVWTFDTGSDHVLGVGRYNENKKLLTLFNFGDHAATVAIDGEYADMLREGERVSGRIELPASGFAWLLREE